MSHICALRMVLRAMNCKSLDIALHLSTTTIFKHSKSVQTSHLSETLVAARCGEMYSKGTVNALMCGAVAGVEHVTTIILLHEQICVSTALDISRSARNEEAAHSYAIQRIKKLQGMTLLLFLFSSTELRYSLRFVVVKMRYSSATSLL